MFATKQNPARTRDRALSEEKKSEPMAWPNPKDRDAELDAALRELGDDLLDEEVPERLLRVLRSAKLNDKSTKVGAKKRKQQKH